MKFFFSELVDYFASSALAIDIFFGEIDHWETYKTSFGGGGFLCLATMAFMPETFETSLSVDRTK